MSYWECAELVVDARRVAHGGTVVDIGVHLGGSLRVWRWTLEPRILVGVDSGDVGSAEETIVRGRSQDPETFNRVADLTERYVDFLCIDGGHRAEEITTDWELYSTLVRLGGIVALHDVLAPETEEVAVAPFWRELRAGHRTKEIWDGVSTGIGVVFL